MKVILKNQRIFPGPEYANNVGADYLNLRKTTIYGGSKDQKNNFKMVLGL